MKRTTDDEALEEARRWAPDDQIFYVNKDSFCTFKVDERTLEEVPNSRRYPLKGHDPAALSGELEPEGKPEGAVAWCAHCGWCDENLRPIEVKR